MPKCEICGLNLKCPKCGVNAKGVVCENCNNPIKHATQYDKCPGCGSFLKVNY